MASSDRLPGPGDEFPPTRPGVGSVAVALAIIIIGLGIMSWAQIAEHIRLAGL